MKTSVSLWTMDFFHYEKISLRMCQEEAIYLAFEEKPVEWKINLTVVIRR